MGEDFYIRAQYASVSGPEFQTTGALPLIAPTLVRHALLPAQLPVAHLLVRIRQALRQAQHRRARTGQLPVELRALLVELTAQAQQVGVVPRRDGRRMLEGGAPGHARHAHQGGHEGAEREADDGNEQNDQGFHRSRVTAATDTRIAPCTDPRRAVHLASRGVHAYRATPQLPRDAAHDGRGVRRTPSAPARRAAA